MGKTVFSPGGAQLGQHNGVLAWRVYLGTGLPPYSRSLQKQISSEVHLINGFYDPIIAADCQDSEGNGAGKITYQLNCRLSKL